MTRLLLLLLPAMLALQPAQAQRLDDVAGYRYPRHGAACSPLCVGASLSWVVPDISFSGSAKLEAIITWVGIESIRPWARCNTGCLAQLGTLQQITSKGAKTFYAWWEEYCSGTGTNCNHIQVIPGFPVAAGDRITASLSCIANCADTTNDKTWTMTLTNLNQGVTWNNNGANFTLSVRPEVVEYGIELPTRTGTPDFGVVRFFDAMVDQGRGLVQAALVPAGNSFSHAGSGVNERFGTASPPMGRNGNDFNVCFTATQTLAASPCYATPYDISGGVGP